MNSSVTHHRACCEVMQQGLSYAWRHKERGNAYRELHTSPHI